jgi:outer membrane biosynthesis protein TonB
MKLPIRSVAWVLPLLLSGCFHKAARPPVQQTAPPVVEPQPVQPPVVEPAPAPAPEVKPPAPATAPEQPKNTEQTPEAVRPPVRHPKKPAQTAQHAQNSGNSNGVSAAGQLSSGGSGQDRDTVNAINSVERGVNGINRKLSDQEQSTANRIHEYLRKARVALDTGDVDGARTLVAKARVLLGELTR